MLRLRGKVASFVHMNLSKVARSTIPRGRPLWSQLLVDQKPVTFKRKVSKQRPTLEDSRFTIILTNFILVHVLLMRLSLTTV